MTASGQKQIQWTELELQYIRDNYQAKTCAEMAIHLGRSTRSVAHKYNQLGLVRNILEIGQIVDGWKIIDKFVINIGDQNRTMVEIESVVGEYRTRKVPMTVLANGEINNPDISKKTGKKIVHHELSKHPLYYRYNGIKNRCYNHNVEAYENYGGRGIKMCEEWKNDFKAFYNWCIANGCDGDKQIDRIDNDGDYCPENCRIVARKINTDNRRVSINITAWGETKNASDWSLDERCKTSYSAMLYRINAGWSAEEAISKPSRSTMDKFKRFKALYAYIKKTRPEIIEEFLLADTA